MAAARGTPLALAFEAWVVASGVALLGTTWALALARLPDVAAAVWKGERADGPGRSEDADVVRAWCRAAAAIARERALWCESVADDGRLLLLVLPFGMVRSDYAVLPRGALCVACQPPGFAPALLGPAEAQRALDAALRRVVPGLARPPPCTASAWHGDRALRPDRGAPRDALEPLSGWAAVPLEGGGVVALCTLPAGEGGYGSGDEDVELPGLYACTGAAEGSGRGEPAPAGARPAPDDWWHCRLCDGPRCLSGARPWVYDLPPRVCLPHNARRRFAVPADDQGGA